VIKKVYYPRLDLLKFLCCVGVVSIHTKPFLYCADAASEIMHFFSAMCVPLFFMASAFLFWRKINFDFANDAGVLKHFVMRLFILYVLWSILILPSWLIGFYHKYPGEWLYLLPFKFLVTGAAHGSWFIMSLIQGILLCYVLNRFLGKIITTILCFAVTSYINFVFHGMPDYLNVYYQYKIFDIWFSPFNAILWIQLGYLIHVLFNIRRPPMFKMCWIVFFLGGAAYMAKDVQYINFIIDILFRFFVLYFCIVPMEKGMLDFSTIRKMSIIVYFAHFVFVILWRVLVEKKILSYEYGLQEFSVVLFSSICVSYVVVKLSEKIKFLKYLY